jgi:hypothetical protein
VGVSALLLQQAGSRELTLISLFALELRSIECFLNWRYDSVEKKRIVRGNKPFAFSFLTALSSISLMCSWPVKFFL